MASKQRSFVIIGLGTFGRTIATELARSGDYVLGIDIDEHAVVAVAEEISEALIADGRDEQAMHEAGVGRYDVAVIGIGEDLEANILCTMNAKRLGVETVWAKAISRTHHEILTKIGADRVIEPEQEIGQHVAQTLHNPFVQDYLRLDKDLYAVQIVVPETLEGKAVNDLEGLDEHELRCIGLFRGREYHACEGRDHELERGDRLLLLGSSRNLRAFGETL